MSKPQLRARRHDLARLGHSRVRAEPRVMPRDALRDLRKLRMVVAGLPQWSPHPDIRDRVPLDPVYGDHATVARADVLRVIDEASRAVPSESDAGLDALRAIEFVHGICPACSGSEPHHEPDCTTARALAAPGELDIERLAEAMEAAWPNMELTRYDAPAIAAEYDRLARP